MSRAYYNEIDPYASQWLRNLIAAGLIAPGDVDERDIRDVMPADLNGYTQCHFFAGVGVWSLALRRAGWPDDRPVWTGSCPCQPFSAAGRKGGFTDERHLWPAWHHLISVRRPPVVFGEQVASKDGLGWLDLVQADLEGTNYASAAADMCAAGVGAPHIRQRLWFVAERLGDAHYSGLEGRRRMPERADQLAAGSGVVAIGLADTAVIGDQRKTGTANHEREEAERPAGGIGRCGSAFDGLANASGQRQPWRAQHDGNPAGSEQQASQRDDAGGCGQHRWMADADGGQSGDERQQRGGEQRLHPEDGSDVLQGGKGARVEVTRGRDPGPVNGFWSDADWIFCRDGKWRSVEPGTQPLADGAAARVGRLRAYGNAIVAEVAATVVASYLDVERNRQPAHPLDPKTERWVQEIEQGEEA